MGQKERAAVAPICETNQGGLSRRKVSKGEKPLGKAVQSNLGLREFANLTDNAFI